MNNVSLTIDKLIKKNRIIYYILTPLILLRRSLLNRSNQSFEKFYESLFVSVEEGSLVVRIPDFLGLFEMDFRSDILKRVLRWKSYEPELVKLAEKYVDPKRDVIDIGANIGLFTVLFSKIISKDNKVLSIEPTPLALEKLYRNIKRNDVEKRVIVYEGVAADSKGDYKLKIIPGLEEYSSLGDIVHTKVSNRLTKPISVKGDTIDNLVGCFDLTPGFIKLDVEGAEYLVLLGTVNTIKRYKPVILFELSDKLLSAFGNNSEEVMNILIETGYEIMDANNPGVNIRMPFDGEIIAIPKLP